MQRHVFCVFFAGGQRRNGAILAACANYVRVLRNKGVLPEYQAWWDFVGANLRRLAVYVLCSKGLYGRVYAMDKAGNRDLSNGVYADDAFIFRVVNGT